MELLKYYASRLKSELATRDAQVTGRKADLIERAWLIMMEP